MVVGLLFLALVVTLVVLAVRKVVGREAGGPADAHAVRRFFQYLLLYGLLVVVGIGLSGLLGRLLERDALVVGSEQALARSLAFTVVGVPLFVGLALWTRRSFRRARRRGRFARLGRLRHRRVPDGARRGDDRSQPGPRLGSPAWRTTPAAGWPTSWCGAGCGVPTGGSTRVPLPREHARLHHLAGSLVGLATAATGLAGLLAGALSSLLGLDGGAAFAGGGHPMLRGLVTLAVGAPVWLVYWVRTASRYERDPLWLAYVLLVGVGGGLVTAITSASTLVYTVLVWLVGDPRSADAAVHFRSAPTAAAAAVVGALVWWYHHAVLERSGVEARSEVRRIYEYLMAGIGLLAAAAGLTTVVVALIEAVTGTARVVVGTSTVNTLLAAATLLAVGVPVWWTYWRRIQSAARGAPAEELASPTRRVYLSVLFGVGGVAAVVALLVGVYLLFADVVEGRLGAETLRRMRFAIGVLLTAATVAAYHWEVFRSDREHVPAVVETRGPRFVLLVGPADPAIAREVARRTHGRVQAWARTDDGRAGWSVDEVMTALGGTTAEEVLVLSDADGLHAIPVHRG